MNFNFQNITRKSYKNILLYESSYERVMSQYIFFSHKNQENTHN